MKNKLKKGWEPKHRSRRVSKASLLPKPDPTLSNHKRMQLRQNARNYHKEMDEQLQEELAKDASS